MKREQMLGTAPSLALTLLPLLGACEAKTAPAAEIMRPVRTQKLLAVGGGKVRRFSGVTQAGQESRLSFRVAGTVRALQVKVGDRVKRGQPIAELDPTDLRLAVQQAQAAHAQARAQEVNAQASYQRTRKLYEANSAAKSNLDAARAAFESARAATAAAAKQIQVARTQLAYTRLSAPAEGVIARCEAEVNENVTPGKTVVVLQSAGVPEVKVTVPEAFIAAIKQGAPAKVTLDSLAGTVLDATVSEVGVASESIGTAYPVTLTIPDPPPALRPGMAAEVSFALGAERGAERFLVPPVAVSEDDKGRFVFVAQPAKGDEALVERRSVTVGELTSHGLEVTRGLKDGELLIVAGVSQIREGLRVKLLPAAVSDRTER